MINDTYLFPLPPARSDMCRDAFLKEVLLPFEISEESSSSEVIIHPIKHLKFGFHGNAELGADNFLMKDFLEAGSLGTARSSRFTETSLKSRQSRRPALDILKIMRERHGDIASTISFLSIHFQLKELTSRLRIMRELWRVDIKLDKSFRMFSWSLKDHFNRFSRRNTTYLDIAEREMGKQMECYKFTIDIREISRLVDAVEEDMRNRADICQNSMLLINDAKLDISEVLTATKQHAEELHANTVLEGCRIPASADPDHSLQREFSEKINYTDFIYPIEARYRLKWAETQGEQFKLWYDQDYVKMLEDLTRLHTQTIESSYLAQTTATAYEMQIANLKKRIAFLEEEYERRIAFIEDEKTVTENRLIQAIEDLKNCKERIPFFHQRIAEVQDILNPPVKESVITLTEPVKEKKKKGNKKKYF